MKPSKLIQACCLALYIVVLSACGADYVPQKFTGFPYGNDRTAGSGIEYVLAHLAAPKGIQADIKAQETVEEKVIKVRAETEIQPPVPMISSKKAEKIFKEFQGKTKVFKLEILRHNNRFSYNQ